MKIEMEAGDLDAKVVRVLVTCGKWHKGIEFSVESGRDPDTAQRIGLSINQAINDVIRSQHEEELEGKVE